MLGHTYSEFKKHVYLHILDPCMQTTQYSHGLFLLFVCQFLLIKLLILSLGIQAVLGLILCILVNYMYLIVFIYCIIVLKLILLYYSYRRLFHFNSLMNLHKFISFVLEVVFNTWLFLIQCNKTFLCGISFFRGKRAHFIGSSRIKIGK